VSFTRRLLLGTVAALLLTVLVLVWSAERSLRRDLASDLGATLEREARLVAAALPDDEFAWGPAVRRLARETGLRITLLDRAGRIRADSDRPAGLSRLEEPALDSAALRQLLAGGPGARVVGTARSRTEGSRMYVAVAGGPGVVRVEAGTGPMDRTLRRARSAMLAAALIALGVAAALALAAGRAVGQPLAALAAAARATAAGASPVFPRSRLPEVGALVQALRQMHRELSGRFEEGRRERAEAAALVEAMTEGVIASDGRGRIITANPAARRLLGYGPGDVLPDLPQLFRVKAARAVVDAALAGTVVQGRELELDGTVLLVNARPLPSGGALLVLHDLTELRRLEAVRRDFVANVSHELKTPLTSISGYAETMLNDRPDPETARRFVETILHNARRMQRLVDGLLDLSRIESGGWQPAPEPVDVAQAAREAWAELGDRAAARGVELALEVDAAPELHADPEAVRQVLGNLLENALRYSPPGGRITCRTRPADGGVTLAVADTGPGIAGEHLPRIFERFYRADPSRSREEGGTGLGLAIVKHLVEAHGGRVWAESERGRGTVVSCWFPPA